MRALRLTLQLFVTVLLQALELHMPVFTLDASQLHQASIDTNDVTKQRVGDRIQSRGARDMENTHVIPCKQPG